VSRLSTTGAALVGGSVLIVMLAGVALMEQAPYERQKRPASAAVAAEAPPQA
jgi:hypothetical protein